MNAKFTEKINEWLTAPQGQRDLAAGAMLLLQLTGNRVQYANVMRRIPKCESYLEHELQKYYNFRVADLNHQQTEALVAQAEKIVEANLSLSTEAENRSLGKRDDHDNLPAEIRQLYTDIPALREKMRDCHRKMREMTIKTVSCPDAERYPFAKEIVRLDNKMRQMWARYDSYKAE